MSGIYVRASKDCAYLLDCGEGTYYQLLQHFGALTDEALLALRVIFISHLHSDHMNGLYFLLHARSKLTTAKSPVYVIVPCYMSEWLAQYSKHVESLECVVLLSQ